MTGLGTPAVPASITPGSAAVAPPPTAAPRRSPDKSTGTQGGTGRTQRRLGPVASAALSILGLIGGIALWWVGTELGLHIPSPAEVWNRAVEMAASGLLFKDLAASLRRVAFGFTAGTALAIPVGFLMGWYVMVRRLVEPYVQFFRMIPPLALLPLTMVLFGIGETAKVWVIFLGAFLSCVISTYQGVVSVDATLVGAARVLGAGDAVIFSRVVVPASTPFILVGMRIGLGAAWATVVASELLAAQAGLGARMLQAQIYFDLPTIFVCVLSIGVVGLAMDRVLLAVERRLTRWQERRA